MARSDPARSGDPLADRRASYAAGLATEGDHAAAADLMRQALELDPDWATGWAVLGGYLEQAGDLTEAGKACLKALALDPADGQGAALKLAALGQAATPDAAPPAFVRALFDAYADRFETSLVERLGYGAPDDLLAAIRKVGGPNRRYAHALDLGCGTGLVGERLRPIAARLSGIDVSPAMIEKARAKGLYDRLSVGNIVDAEPGGEGIDLVTAADVFIYLGDLSAVFACIARLLRADGLFAFTVEAHDGPEPFAVGPSLRFRHSRDDVAALAQQAGFAVVHEERLVIRQDRGEPVEGFAFVMERSAA